MTCGFEAGPVSDLRPNGDPRLPTPVLLALLTVGTFAVGSNNFVVAGLLPPISTDLGVSVAAAGQLTTLFAVSYAITAPALAVLLGDGDRRIVLAGGALLFGLGAVLQAAAPSMSLMLVAQVLAGAGAALYVSNATATAGALVPEHRRGRALAVIYTGFTLATLAGGPLGLLVAQAIGWRGVLFLVAACAVTAAVGTVALPEVHLPKAGIARRVGVLARRPVLLTLLVITLAQGAVMGSQVYLPTILTPAAGALLPLLLAAGGAGNVLGNWTAGRLVDRLGPTPLRHVALGGLTLVLGGALPLLLDDLGWLFVVLPLFGLFGGMVLVPQQHRLVAAASDAPGVALGWGSSAVFLGAAIGSAAGGAVLAGPGAVWLGPAAVVLVALALLTTLFDTPTTTPPPIAARGDADEHPGPTPDERATSDGRR